MLLLMVILTLLLDQVIKQIILENFYLGESFPLIKNIFHITYVKNTGAAFGILQNQTRLFSILRILIIILLLYLRKEYLEKKLLIDVSLGLIIGGALGNFIDRIWLGFVVDYIDLQIWPVFNLADSAVVIGSILMTVYIWNSELEI
mgnify:FL=1